MTTATKGTVPPELATYGRRFGYGVSIGVNAVLLWIVSNLLDWDIFPFLTERFADISPLIMTAIVVTMIADALHLVADEPRAGTITAIVADAVSLFVTIRFFQIFPFDFSAYEFNWGLLARFVLVIAIVGTAVGLVVDLAKFVRSRL